MEGMRSLDKEGGTQYTLFYRTFDEVAYFRVPKSVGTALKCFSDEKMQPSSKKPSQVNGNDMFRRVVHYLYDEEQINVWCERKHFV